MTDLPKPEPNAAPKDPGSTYLGALLVGQPGAARPSEADWVGLLQSIAQGDERALHVLYQRSHRLVFTLMMRMTGRLDTAEELTVDVFHDVWSRASGYDAAGGTVLGWMMNQARSRAIDRMRHDTRQKRGGHVTVEALQEDAVAEAVPETVEVEDQGRVLRTALERLTPDERQAIETAYFETRSYREVAERLQQPIGTIKTRIRSGLGKLRDALAHKREDL